MAWALASIVFLALVHLQRRAVSDMFARQRRLEARIEQLEQADRGGAPYRLPALPDDRPPPTAKPGPGALPRLPVPGPGEDRYD